jgi:hypothetical protein
MVKLLIVRESGNGQIFGSQARRDLGSFVVKINFLLTTMKII